MPDLNARAGTIIAAVGVLFGILGTGGGLVTWISNTNRAASSVDDLKVQVHDSTIDLQQKIHDAVAQIQAQIGGLPEEHAALSQVVRQQEELARTLADMNARIYANQTDVIKLKAEADGTKAQVDDVVRASNEPTRRPR